MTYKQISDAATTTWKPLPGSKNLGYYLASGQVQFSTFVGYKGGAHFQECISRINQNTTKRVN